jgi:hypothetical protein
MEFLMNKYLLIPILLLFSLPALSQDANDPMGLSNYIMHDFTSPNHSTWGWRRLTNYEVNQFQGSGAILPDGSIDVDSTSIKYDSQSSGPKPQPTTHASPQLAKKPLPTSKHIAKQTKTKHVGHPDSKGGIQVRPKQFPASPTKEDIIHMQQDIQHIERTVGKALDLSLSAYAVAELPQATEGRSGVSLGLASADGKTGEAIGFSSNFGDLHEYTIKISISHAGSQEAAGVGASYQW